MRLSLRAERGIPSSGGRGALITATLEQIYGATDGKMKSVNIRSVCSCMPRVL